MNRWTRVFAIVLAVVLIVVTSLLAGVTTTGGKVSVAAGGFLSISLTQNFTLER